MMQRLLIGLSALAITVPCAAQTAPPAAAQKPVASAELRQRIGELVPLLNGAGDYAATFSPAFVAAISKDAFGGLAKQLAATAGKAVTIERITPTGAWSATIVIAYERGKADAQISVDPAGSHQVTSLRITGMSGSETSLAAIDAALAGLPGRTGFAVAKLGTGTPAMISARNANAAFAIGSEFKLVILAELVRGIGNGERHWDDIVTLDGTPLPGGLYTASPAGTKATLYEIAERMISVSDNSATDIMLKALGRDKVEAMLPVVGIRDPKGMRPFLGTLEIFKLKGGSGGALGQRWLALDEAGRRALLDTDVKAMPNAAIDGQIFARGKPVLIDRIEWFATPADMIRVMNWLRRNTESGPAARARDILSKNSGVGAGPAGKYRYLGYKGGSEPGVIAMTFLLQGKDGAWQAMSASWNDAAAAVDDARFAGLMARAVELAAGE